jgi:hypothetical protein
MGKLQIPGLRNGKKARKLKEKKEWILDKPHF